MKKYKTWEALKMLDENSKLQFKNPCGNVLTRKNNYISEDGINKLSGDIFYKGHTWELIQEPVSFMEAVKAYSEGKTIRCEINGSKYEYIPKYHKSAIGQGVWLRSQTDTILSTTMILEGKWYIESEESTNE